MHMTPAVVIPKSITTLAYYYYYLIFKLILFFKLSLQVASGVTVPVTLHGAGVLYYYYVVLFIFIPTSLVQSA